MTPSVRGNRRLQVAVLLVLSATLSGALAGLAAGALWSLADFPALAPSVVLVAVVAALVADAVHARWGRLSPFCIRRQVPRVWGRLFDIRTAATVFGARLGVGPLTHLNSWLWWVGALLAASRGPASSTFVGSVFGAVRMITVVAASHHVRRETPARMAALRQRG